MGKWVEASIEDMAKALRICATDPPEKEHPCEGCYLYPFSRDGYMSTGRTCFEHLALDVIDKLTRLNNFSESQCAILLAENSRLTAENERLEIIIEQWKLLVDAALDKTGSGAAERDKKRRVLYDG